MISCVVPIYNMEKYIERCMNALLSQQGDYEIILVDDGSTDSSGKLCDDYEAQYPELVKVIHKSNNGLSSARNAGIDAAKGEYIIFADPDDWTEPDYISRLCELQKQHNPDLLCVGYFVDYDDNCRPAGEGQCFAHMNSATAQRMLLTSVMGGFAWNKLYHTDIIRKNNLYFYDDVGTTEDLDFAFSYLEYCDSIVFSPEDRLYHYYQRSGAATHSRFSSKQLDSIHTYEKIIDASADDGVILAAKEEICNTAVNLLWNYRMSNADYPGVLSAIKANIRKYIAVYIKSNRYGMGRKLQAVLACFMPGLYILLKKRISKDR